MTTTLDDVRLAIRLGFLDEAMDMLDCAPQAGACDPNWLNLAGVIHELRRDWASARRFYGRAIRADRSHIAAQQNMRRLFELFTFGRSNERIALGDERPVLMRLLTRYNR